MAPPAAADDDDHDDNDFIEFPAFSSAAGVCVFVFAGKVAKVLRAGAILRATSNNADAGLYGTVEFNIAPGRPRFLCSFPVLPARSLPPSPALLRM